MTAVYRLHPIGVHDIDGDGTAEVCMAMGYWEGAEHFALRCQNGRWGLCLTRLQGRKKEGLFGRRSLFAAPFSIETTAANVYNKSVYSGYVPR